MAILACAFVYIHSISVKLSRRMFSLSPANLVSYPIAFQLGFGHKSGL